MQKYKILDPELIFYQASCLIIYVWLRTPEATARSFYNDLKRCAADAPSAIAGITVAATGRLCPVIQATARKRAQQPIVACLEWIKFVERRAAKVLLQSDLHIVHATLACEIVLWTQQKFVVSQIHSAVFTRYQVFMRDSPSIHSSNNDLHLVDGIFLTDIMTH